MYGLRSDVCVAEENSEESLHEWGASWHGGKGPQLDNRGRRGVGKGREGRGKGEGEGGERERGGGGV